MTNETWLSIYFVGVSITSLIFFIFYCKIDTFSGERMDIALSMAVAAVLCFLLSLCWPILLATSALLGFFYLLTFLVM